YAAKFRESSDSLRVPGTAVIKAFEDYSTVGVGIPIDPDILAIDGSWQIVINGAAPVYEVAIEGSLVSKDGPYEPMSTMSQTDVKLRHWNGKPVPYTQAILNNISGGGSIDLYLIKRGN
ncbi:hypothetical protein KAR91_59195, partial [Candidatus Pacearchaeota archaeon]|nr:hypothetical protein [Candidatus Pacearchaeota archaeon]